MGPNCGVIQEGNPLTTFEPDPVCISQYPFFDPNLEIVNYYVPPAVNFCYLGVNNGVDPFNYDDSAMQGLMLQAINKANQDWKGLYDPTTAVPNNLSNGGNIIAYNISFAIVDNIANDSKLDIWYPGSTFKKYGIFGFGYNATKMPVEWINLKPCTFVATDGVGFDGFMYSFTDIVTGTITTYQRLTIPYVVAWGYPQQFPV